MKRLVALAACALASCMGVQPQLSAPAATGETGSASAPIAEEHRPLWHYTPPSGWMNDPNGMVYKDGEYHLYYQHYPDDTVWGPMHWGHAVSRDLVNWQTLPIALAPDKDGFIFSGSAVTDPLNTAGFGKDALIAIYTIHDPTRADTGQVDDESQGIAYSLDNGRNFTKFSGNPVLANPGAQPDFRDPSVFWDENTNRWIMALSVTDHVRFYGSDDLKDWAYLSSFGTEIVGPDGVWECPNLFPIRDEVSGETKWVLLLSLINGGPQGGSATQYFVGDWDGSSFTLDAEFEAELKRDSVVWFDHGADNYAGVTWNGAPDGRRIFMGWMSNWMYAEKVPTQQWRSAMTAPRELTLHGTELRQKPAEELAVLRGTPVKLEVFEHGAKLPGGLLPSAELNLVFEAPENGWFQIQLSNTAGEELLIGMDAQGWYIDRRNSGKVGFHPEFAKIHRASRKKHGAPIQFRLLMDRASVELFADDGATVMTTTFYPSEDYTIGEIRWSEDTRLNNAEAWWLAEGGTPAK